MQNVVGTRSGFGGPAAAVRLEARGYDITDITGEDVTLSTVEPFDWGIEAERDRRKIEANLERTLLSELGRHGVNSRGMTPTHFRDGLLVERGATFSLDVPHA